jgi:hypothetical protein
LPGHQCHEDRNDAVESALLVGEVENLRLHADLAHEERRGLGADDLAIGQKIDSRLVGTGRNVSRQAQVRAEQTVAEKLHLPHLGRIEASALLIADQGVTPGPRHVRRGLGARQLEP